jgi:hypothetical protein
MIFFGFDVDENLATTTYCVAKANSDGSITILDIFDDHVIEGECETINEESSNQTTAGNPAEPSDS